MFHSLKRRITILGTVSMFLLMAILIFVMNSLNYTSVIKECDSTLEMLSSTNLLFYENLSPRRMFDFIPQGMSPEVPYEARFFSVTVLPEGKVLDSNFSRIVTVDNDSVKAYVEKALSRSGMRGFVGQFRYLKIAEGDGASIYFLDCGRRLGAFFKFLTISTITGILAVLVVFLLFLFYSGRLIRPIAQSYTKQKRFISDAGHEMKTLLTIISANLDLLETDEVKADELDDIRRQTERLMDLTKNLVLLSRMDEKESPFLMSDFPLSDLLSETTAEFRPVASVRKIQYRVRLEPDLSFHGSPDSIKQLLSVLLDNAMKYSPESGVVTVDLEKEKKGIVLTVFNTTSEEVEKEELPYLFDRFYRSDSSRNSETGGYGIGLSLARAIVDSYHGKISATTSNGFDFTISVFLPA